VRSCGGKDPMNDVAAWFIDHDYDEESFFVRQAYFVGKIAETQQWRGFERLSD
jgi:adenine-specific DNA-methyltransferase